MFCLQYFSAAQKANKCKAPVSTDYIKIGCGEGGGEGIEPYSYVPDPSPNPLITQLIVEDLEAN